MQNKHTMTKGVKPLVNEKFAEKPQRESGKLEKGLKEISGNGTKPLKHKLQK